MFSLICVWINGWVNNREAGDLRRHRGHYDVIVMYAYSIVPSSNICHGIWTRFKSALFRLGHMITFRVDSSHDGVIKWKHFPRYRPFVRGIHRWPLNSPHKGQWRRASKISLTFVWANCWVNKRESGDLRRHRAHYDVTVFRNVYPYHPGLLHWHCCSHFIDTVPER